MSDMRTYTDGYNQVMKVAGLEKVALNERLLRRLLNSEFGKQDWDTRGILEKYRQGTLGRENFDVYRKLTEWGREFSPQGVNRAPYSSGIDVGRRRELKERAPEALQRFEEMQQNRARSSTQEASRIMQTGRHSPDDVVDFYSDASRTIRPESATPNPSSPFFNPDRYAYRGESSKSTSRHRSKTNSPDAPRWVTAHPEIATAYAIPRAMSYAGTGNRPAEIVPGTANYINRVDLSRIPDNAQGPWTPNVSVDTRKMSPEDIQGLRRDEAVSWPHLPQHEKVVDNRSLQEAIDQRFKLLPDGRWMRVKGDAATDPLLQG